MVLGIYPSSNKILPPAILDYTVWVKKHHVATQSMHNVAKKSLSPACFPNQD